MSCVELTSTLQSVHSGDALRVSQASAVHAKFNTVFLTGGSRRAKGEQSLEECREYGEDSDTADADSTTPLPVALGEILDRDVSVESIPSSSNDDDTEENLSKEINNDVSGETRSSNRPQRPQDGPRGSVDRNGNERGRPGGGRDYNRDLSFFMDFNNGQDFPLRNRLGYDREQRCRDQVGRIPHDRMCHHYFDCSSPFEEQPLPFVEPYEKECPYPQQFSLETYQCEDYRSVDCAGRQEIVDPCEYLINSSTAQ
ncbi:fibropellin-1 [Elysia marginata]|uniref:Fibropellin-1 n=1 Tax=Elysia marginata TaxID=1093978 RepID=A0AAV4I5T5_9GAST|nr:fibropellin-1 [Elysia marginata]